MNKEYCSYYQARVRVEKTWFIVGVFRNEDHIAFERTLDGDHSILEFFVPVDQEQNFLQIIQSLQKRGYIYSCERLENRLIA